MTFNNPDFVGYADAYGAKGTRVRAIGDFIPTLERAFTEGGVQLVVVPIDHSVNICVLVDELREQRPVS
jgi:acetolactate synthase-1/2/3 large subunit